MPFYLPPTRLSKYGISDPAFTPQPHSIIALWPVLIFHHAVGRRLSWAGWLRDIWDDLPAQRWSLIHY